MAERFVVEPVVVARELPGPKLGRAKQTGLTGPKNISQRHPVLDWLIVLAKRKSFILKSVCVAALGSAVMALLLPNTYTANARVLAAGQHQVSSIGLVDQLQLPGSASNGTEIDVAILRSETVANRLIDRFSLMNVYGVHLRVEARQKLADWTNMVEGKGGVISISVGDHDAQRAADLANAYVEELELLTRDLDVGQTHKRREFLSRQVAATSEQLASAERELRATEESTGLVLFDPQTKSLIEQAARMRAKVGAQEVHVEWLRTFAAPENPELVRAVQELAAARDEQKKLEAGDGTRSGVNVPLEGMPASSLEYGRKVREVTFREFLLNLLTQQLQSARVDESRSELMVQPPVQLLDRAVPAEEKSAPHRLLIVLAVTALALFLSILCASVMEKMDQTRYARKPPARVPLYTLQLQEQIEEKRNVEIA